jgi:hypothetical protein
MNILFIGDIIGKPGRRAVRELLPRLAAEAGIDVVIANCENAAAGFGVTRDVVEELYRDGIHVLTSGNHFWDKKEVLDFAEDYETLLRPANYPDGVPGWGSAILPTSTGEYVGVLNLAGRVFMAPLDCPFRTADRELARLEKKARIIIVDVHAEATSEKQALGWYLAGRVSAVIGTHTHVQTADACIRPGGTAYLTDAGMTGPFESVIGIGKDIILERFLSLTPRKYDVAKGDIRLQGAIVSVDEKTGRATDIQAISRKLEAG